MFCSCTNRFNFNRNFIILNIGLAIQVNVNEVKECCSKEINYPLTPIYCYGGNNKTILSVFQTIMVCIKY